MAYGVREIIAGVGIFGSGWHRAEWVWFRVIGDVLDVATVLYVFLTPNPPFVNVAIALVMLLGVGLIDLWTASALSAQKRMARDTDRYLGRSGLPDSATARRPH
jgi:hypothetical protein